jgi:molybdate transport system substrate-binding protein
VRLFLLAAAVLIAASAPGRAERGLVFAAASTTDAMDAAIERYREQTGAEVVASYAASSMLARQIEHDAPANLFVSADPEWMDYLAERGLIEPGSRRERLGNRLALVAPADSGLEATIGPGFALAEALGDGLLAVGDPTHVPAGRYARAALESLGLWRGIARSLVGALDVRAALALVDRGEVSLAVVYDTDTAVCAHCRVVGLFPEDSHPPIRYPLALVAGNATAQARAFHAFLLSPEAAAVFERHGFSVH